MADDSGQSPEDLSQTSVVVFAALFESALAPLALFVGWLLGQPALASFSWNARDAGIGVLAAFPMLAALAAALRWPIGPLARIERFFDKEVRPLLGNRPWSDLALISLAAGIGEEMLFRGVFQAAFGRWLRPGAGLAIASLLFGLLHPITLTYIVIAALMGAYLGVIWLLNGNLLTVMIAHAVYDFLALIVLFWETGTEPEADP